MPNAVLEQIHQVLGNLVRTFNISQTYANVDDLWKGSLAESLFLFAQEPVPIGKNVLVQTNLYLAMI